MHDSARENRLIAAREKRRDDLEHRRRLHEEREDDHMRHVAEDNARYQRNVAALRQQELDIQARQADALRDIEERTQAGLAAVEVRKAEIEGKAFRHALELIRAGELTARESATVWSIPRPAVRNVESPSCGETVFGMGDAVTDTGGNRFNL
ncbi:hypothetical protein [Peterkaempfera griseoplana]|uniref:hypothetical protein n=1 Tax=Peterkaempfera griseoplana TaxID=66896 RepID=UPI0012FEF253|nr:hypothetical protein [Peterkaempfera griseoplana]